MIPEWQCEKILEQILFLLVSVSNSYEVIIPMKTDSNADDEMEAYYTINKTHIHVHTRTLSAYLCTSCKKICAGEQNVFICGGIRRRGNRLVTEIRPYVCNLLTSIEDFEKVNYMQAFVKTFD